MLSSSQHLTAANADKPLHVRVLAGSLQPTAGSHIYSRNLIRHLVNRGYRVSVVCLEQPLDDLGTAEVICLPRFAWDRVPLAWRFAAPLDAALLKARLRWAELETPDIVIASEHLLLKPHAQRFSRTPWIYLPHSLVISDEIDSYQLSGIQHSLTKHAYVGRQRWALGHATQTMRFNRTAANALTEYYGQAAIRSPVVINPSGIPLPSKVPSEKRHGDRLNFLFAGRLVPSKNLSFVLESLQQHSGRHWTLSVVGDGPERGRCEDLTRTLGIDRQVTFHGHQTGMTDWYSRSDVLLFPSKLENMPLVLMEAMAHGLPALTIQADGKAYRVPFSEFVKDGSTGLLATDESDFQSRLNGLLTGEVSPGRIGVQAALFARDHFGWEQHIDRLEQQIESLVVRHRDFAETRIVCPSASARPQFS